MANIEIKDNGLSVEIDRQEFALELKKWRLRNELTQEQVGQRWGCSRFTIIRAEGAKPCNWETAYRLFNKLSKELQHEVHDDNRH